MNISKVTYILTDVEGDDIHWENVTQNTEIFVNADTIMLATTDVSDEYELIIRLRAQWGK